MELSDQFAFGACNIERGLPPIVGSEGVSVWLSGDGHISLPVFPLTSEDEFSIGIDVQPDTTARCNVVGAQKDTAFVALQLNEPALGIITLTIRDAEGQELVAHGEGSSAAARRLFLVGQRSTNDVAMYELQPWAQSQAAMLNVEISKAESPRSWPLAQAGLAVGGILIDGKHQAGYDGRLSEGIIFGHRLTEEKLKELSLLTDNPAGLHFDRLSHLSAERVTRFQRDLRQLRSWVTRPRTSEKDLDDASLILFRWLFDKRPLLEDLAAKLGVQLWLAGMTERERAYLDIIEADKPIFQMAGDLGQASPFGHKWCALSEWRSNPAFHANGHAISHEAFVKFVRNKLGAGHFDEDDRTRWQKDLLTFADGLELMGTDALTYQMKAIVQLVLQSVAVCRLEALTSV